jgi:hypothetical protein
MVRHSSVIGFFHQAKVDVFVPSDINPSPFLHLGQHYQAEVIVDGSLH